MTMLTRFDPLTEMTRIDPFRDFDNLFRGFMMRPLMQSVADGAMIRLDVLEDDKSYTIKADIPGVKKEDIHISAEGNQISISAERKMDPEQKNGKRVVYSDRHSGSLERSFTLDKDVELGGAKAKYADGVLEAVLPKKQGASPRQIAIS